MGGCSNPNNAAKNEVQQDALTETHQKEEQL